MPHFSHPISWPADWALYRNGHHVAVASDTKCDDHTETNPVRASPAFWEQVSEYSRLRLTRRNKMFSENIGSRRRRHGQSQKVRVTY